MIQITVPTVIAATIPWIPVIPAALKTNVVTISVAMAIPDTGLLLLPTIPTIREDTVAKKKPKITMMIAPTGLIGIAGASHITMATTTMPMSTVRMEISVCVLSPVSTFLPKPFMALANVRTMVGNVLIRLMIPPAATAPAPIYRLYSLQMLDGSS